MAPPSESSQPSSPADPRSSLNRPPSIGDASQLFGGGSGSDDFFGPPSTFAASLFDPVPEESSVQHDPFAWPPTDHPRQPEPSFGSVPEAGLTQPASTPYDPHPIPPADYSNPYEAPANYHSYAPDQHQPSSQPVYSSPNPNFGLQDHHNNANGTSVPHLQTTYADQQPSFDNYNPYVPADPYAAPQNAYPSHISHPHLMADVIPRSASANASTSSASTNQNPSHLSVQRPKLLQSSSVFNRPKVYDAYDPPAIRKKKPTFAATASLPASPALGGHGFPTQTIPSSLGFPPQSSNVSIPPPPPPSIKQRSTSTPASHHEPVQESSVDFNDFYAQTSHNIQDAARQFVPYVYPNSSPMMNSASSGSFSVDPYLPNPSTDYGTPLGQVTPKPGLANQYPQNPPQQVEEHQYTQPFPPPVQSSGVPYSPNSQSEDPYAPDQSNLSLDTGKTSTPLSPNDFYRPYEPTESAGSNGAHKPKLQASSPLKTTVVAQDDVPEFSGGNHLSRDQPMDPMDVLSSATHNLSLNPSSVQEPTSTQVITNRLRTTSPAPLPDSTSKRDSLMQVPDVHVQPATPQITLLEAHDSAPTSQFDVLADLSSSSSDQPMISSNTSNQTLDHFDYEASNDSSFQYNSDYSYEATQPNMQDDSTVSLDNSQPYNPYSAPIDSVNQDPNSNLNSYPSSQSVNFTNSGQHPPYPHLSHPQSSFSLQSETISSDQAMAHHQNSATTWTPGPATDEPVLDTNAYNPYNPLPQANAGFSDRQVEDPMLERLTAQVPVASFGFGGKLITVFPVSTKPTNNPLQAGYTDPYGSSGIFPEGTDTGSTVVVQRLSEVIPSNDLQNFPGPLFMEGGSKSNLAKKRKEVVKWLEDKLDESEKELAFVQSQLVGRSLNSDDGKDLNADNLQDKIILLKLLQLLVENEGKLSGTSKVDEAVRLVLQPTIAQPTLDSNPIPSSGFNTQDIITTYSTRSSHLNSIQVLLSNGDRQQAIQTAVEQRMWPHALIIAHSLGNEVWHETVKEFVRFELGDGDVSAPGGTVGSDSQLPPSKGREGLRTLYTLFAGAGPAAVEEFSLSGAHASPSALQFEQHGMSAIPTAVSNGTVPSSRVPSPAPLLHPTRSCSIKIPNNVLQQWRSVVAMTVANRVHGSTPFLLRLGDTLASNGKIYAAHITYLLSNGQMPQLCLDNSNRITLLGSPTLSTPDRPGLDLEAVILTEVLEFALSLCTVPKNVEPFIGIPHLQAYRLALGFEYATFGMADRANKYCEALTATLKLATKPSVSYHPALLEQIKAFSGRLSSTPVGDKGSSWITRKMPRPILDNVWQTLEGRVHKFVAGDDDEGNNPSASAQNGSTTQKSQALGPFSHYSSISAGGASEAVSRVQSSNDLGYMNNEPVGRLAGPFHHNSHLQRPSSGAGYSPSNYSQEPRRVSLSSSYNGSNLSPVDFLSFRGQTSSVPPLQHEPNSLGSASPANSASQTTETVGKENTTFTGSSGGGWWEASNSYGTPVNSAPQPMFESIKDTPVADGGFIDPMASFGVPSFTTSPAPANFSSQQNGFDAGNNPSPFDNDDEEDLGFGNNSSRKRDRGGPNNQGNPNEHHTDSPSSNKVNEKHQDKSEGNADSDDKSIKPKASSSWIGRWFKRETTPTSQGPGPVKANLGEEFSLVYDPETKRWVNKKAGSSQTAASSGPPPPPPRAQTASPTSSMRSSFVPPPPSSMNNNNSSPGQPSFNRSNSAGLHNVTRASLDVPPSSHSQPALAPPSSSTPPPSSSSTQNPSKKPHNKKNIRSRYVEIR